MGNANRLSIARAREQVPDEVYEELRGFFGAR